MSRQQEHVLRFRYPSSKDGSAWERKKPLWGLGLGFQQWHKNGISDRARRKHEKKSAESDQQCGTDHPEKNDAMGRIQIEIEAFYCNQRDKTCTNSLLELTVSALSIQLQTRY